MIRNFLIVSILFAFVLSSCERDDICAASTPTTPQLVVQFFDVANTSLSKPVIMALVKNDNSDTLLFARDTILRIPLRTDTTATVLKFIKNPGNQAAAEDPDNTDILTFTYLTNEIFINRACGFKVTFDNLNVSSLPGTDGRWIDDLIVNSQSITDENTTHLSIFH